MTAIALSLVCLGSFALLWTGALFIVPAHVNSLFRYRLWNLRDDLFDLITDDKISQSPIVLDLLDAIETFIHFSEQFNLTTFLAGRLSGLYFIRTKSSHLNTESLDMIGPSEQEVIVPVLDNLYSAVVTKLLMGSPFGWPLFLLQYLFNIEDASKPLFNLISNAFKGRTKAEAPYRSEFRRRELRRLRQIRDAAISGSLNRESPPPPLATQVN